jgi:hypothetical protein
MKALRTFSLAAIGCSLFGVSGSGTSCLRPPAGVTARLQSPVRTLSPAEAAELAERLANQESERLYKRRPFGAGQHPAVLTDGEYEWGGLDQGAPGGYSALVRFAQDGSNPKVEVYFSTDPLSPPR